MPRLAASWTGRRVLVVAIVLTTLLHAPSLGIGFLSDDYAHQVVLAGDVEATTMRPWDLYAFGSSAEDRGAFEIGGLLWWTSDDWKVRFCRPLTSISLWFDHNVFGRRAWLWHLENLAWLALGIALLQHVLRGIGLASGVVACALLLFAVDDGSTVAVGWLANRNSLLATVFGIASMAVLGDFRRTPNALRIGAAFALAGLGCLTKESGVALFLLVGWRLSCGAATRAQRIAAWSIGFGLVLAYVFTWHELGYGANSRFYPAPWEQPEDVVARGIWLALTAPLAFISPIPLDLAFAYPQSSLWIAALGVLLLPMLARPLVRALHGRRRVGLFLLGWVALALAPQASAPASDRLLFEAAPAGVALIALAVDQLTRERSKLAPTLWCSAFFLTAASLVLRQALLVTAAGDARQQARNVVQVARTAGARDVLLLQTPSPMAALASGAQIRADLGVDNVHSWPLQMGGRPLRVVRVSNNVVELESLGLPFLSAPLEQVFRSPHDPLTDGRRYRCRPFEASLLRVADDGARGVRIELATAADGSRPIFATWTRDGVVRVELPEVGASIELPRWISPIPMGS